MDKAPEFDEQGRKFLFYHGGVPVYEGDERHQMLERCRKEFGGDMIKMAKFDAQKVGKFLKKR